MQSISSLMRNYESFLSGLSPNGLTNDKNRKKINAIIENLSLFSTYGLYDIIVPFLETVHVSCSKDVAAIIDERVQLFSDAGFIISTLDKYHSEILNRYNKYKTTTPFGTVSDENAWRWAFEQSEASIEENVWNCYDLKLINNVADSIKRNMGLWIPGLYTKSFSKDYLHKLSREFVYSIENAIRERRENPGNRLLTMIIYRQLRKVLSELRLHYCYSSYAEHYFFHMDIKDIRKLSGRELKDKLFCEIQKTKSKNDVQMIPDPFYDYDEEWVKAVERICELYVSEFGIDKNGTVDRVEVHVPLLYQLIDQYDKAETKLIHILNNGAKIYNAGLLISCTIVLAKTRNDDSRNWICSYLENAYSLHMKNDSVKKYISLLSDTVSFFEMYFNRVREHIKSMSDEDQDLYTLKMALLMQRTNNLLDEESDMWVYTYLVKDNILIKQLQICKDKIEESENPLIDGDWYIKRSMEIFYNASSHLGNNARISADNLLDALDQPDPTQNLLEVFYNTEYYDAEWHDSLLERYQQLQCELPSMKYTQRAMEVIQEFCHGYSIIRKKLINACAEICNNPWNCKNYVEDNYNIAISGLLRAGLADNGYWVKDQGLQSLGKSGRRPCELDIQIIKGNLTIAIYEGLMDQGPKWRKEHIDKAINRYNISGCRIIFIVELSHREDFAGYWESAKKTLHEYPLIRVEETDSEMNGIKVCEGSFDWNGNGEGDFVFIGVNCNIPTGCNT